MPLGTDDTTEKFPSVLASLAGLPGSQPAGEHAGAAFRSDADAQPCGVPNSSGEGVGAKPSWDS